MQRLKKKFLMAGSGITLVAFLLLHAGFASAEEGGDDTVLGDVPTALPERPAQAPVAAQGMRVYRDPQTGKLGPPPPGITPPGLTAAEQRMLNRSDQGLRPLTLPGGGVAIDLQGRFRNMAVATVGADGQAVVNCDLTPAQAAAVLQAGQQDETGPAD
jgi:hypothetical protein